MQLKKAYRKMFLLIKLFYDKAEHIHMEVLPMKYVKCFDQYHIQDNRKEKEYVMMLAKAIIDKKNRLYPISYINWQDKGRKL